MEKNKADKAWDELQALRDENAKLKAEVEKQQAIRPLVCKVSEKGALSVYGLGRFPVTLYKQQWARLVAFGSEITAYLAENDGLLKTKGDEAFIPRGPKEAVAA